MRRVSPGLPESVADSVLKVHKLFVIEPKQVARVEVQVALLQHVAQPLLLCLHLVAGVADERRPLCNFSHQESCLT